jgi:hypothetical protein
MVGLGVGVVRISPLRAHRADVEATVAEPHSRALSKRVEGRTGLTITHHRIDFFGRCRECRARSAEQTSSGSGYECSRRAFFRAVSARRHGDGWANGKIGLALCHERSEAARKGTDRYA